LYQQVTKGVSNVSTRVAVKCFIAGELYSKVRYLCRHYANLWLPLFRKCAL